METAQNTTPAWSPDGQKIAFSSGRDLNDEIYVMNADGSAQTRLTDDWKADAAPTWSADGRKIAFTSNRDLNMEIYVIEADGSHVACVTNDSADDEFADWAWAEKE